ncbi:MAG: SHOCT domain-containing protein [Actinobacteria bacterium]|nr:SHOCT domain-containing protein [Actinomycetota bacterium]
MQIVRILADAGGWAHMGGWGWSMALTGGLVMISIVALVVWTVVYSSPKSKEQSSHKAFALLDERYAVGAIDRDEYLRRWTDLNR